MNAEVDVRDILPLIRVPTLVLHRSGDRCLKVEEGRYVAARIPGAKFVELPGSDHLPFVGDQDALLAEIERFVAAFDASTGEEGALATVLCVRPAGARDRAHEIQAIVSSVAAQHRGELFDQPGEPPLATFDGPGRAIRAGLTALAMLSASGLEASAGLHTGECVRRRHHVTGAAVDVARAIAQRAGAGELLISRTVKDLVAGVSFGFTERGRHAVAQGGGEWRLYKVEAPPAAAAGGG